MSQRLDYIVQFYAEHNHFMGTILVARGEHLLLNQGYGFASLEWQIPNTPDTEFTLGSNTKQFTAVLILGLQKGVSSRYPTLWSSMFHRSPQLGVSLRFRKC